jgi:hypothetical protein
MLLDQHPSVSVVSGLMAELLAPHGKGCQVTANIPGGMSASTTITNLAS